MINSRHVNVLRPDTGGKYTSLYDFLMRRRVMRMPFSEVQVISVSGAQFKLIDSTTHLPAGVLTVLKTGFAGAITNGGVCASELAGAVGTAATTHIQDDLGNILNLVLVRDSSTHEELKTADGRTIFGLVQCANAVVEGAAIGAAASENTQISFVYIAADGTITLAAAFTASVEFQVNKLYMESHVPTIFLEGGNQEAIIVEPKVAEPFSAYYTVTTAFAANEVITIATGAGAASGVSIPAGDYDSSQMIFPASAILFNAHNNIRVRLNGVQLIRGVEVIWDSTTTFHITSIMDVNDVLEVEIPAKY